MRTLLALAVVGGAVLATAQPVSTPVNLALRIGAAYPIDNNTRDLVKNFIGAGFDYFFDRSLVAGGETSVSVDWLGKSGSGAHGNIFPMMINQRWYNPNSSEEAGTRGYFFLGAGAAIIDVNNSKTVLAARAGFGREFGEHIFGEINIILSDDADGARANSAGVYLGYRF
ncbi:MAG: hypothetical protein JNM34_00665 [Chthonomonadaceae bacterium]|jgi:hypothetical protein|nr:hypothetical protein [Chthonomonadaceae bacterium]